MPAPLSMLRRVATLCLCAATAHAYEKTTCGTARLRHVPSESPEPEHCPAVPPVRYEH